MYLSHLYHIFTLHAPHLLPILSHLPSHTPKKPLPPIPLCLHRLRHLGESRNITTSHQTWQLTLSLRLHIFLRSRKTILKAIPHNELEFGVDFFRSPRHTLGVLGHFETGDCNAAGVGGFACT